MTKVRFFLAGLLLSVTAHATPEHSPWPGGVAVIRVGGENRPVVVVDDKTVLVTRQDGAWFAVVGIPLEYDIGSPLLAIVSRPGVADENIVIDVHPVEYRVQRLTVASKYVEPDQASLDRIFAEREVIDSALNHWRDHDLDDVMLQAPVPGNRSTSFGSRRVFNDQPRSPHKGMDISATSGTPILAPRGGIVTATGDFYFNGNTVILDHGQGYISLFCHLSAIDVNDGQPVNAGDLLGKVGATGRVTGAHLHFATYLNGTAVDPALLLEEK